MKHRVVCSLLVAAVIAVGATLAFAADKQISAKVTSVAEATTKNGDPYVRVIVNEPRKLNGVEYMAGVPVMFFGANVETAKSIREGQTLTAIVAEREYNGGKSYTAQAVVKIE